MPAQRSAGGGYPISDGDSQVAQLARDNAPSADDDGGYDTPVGAGAGGGSVDAAPGGSGAGGGLLGMLSAERVAAGIPPPRWSR